MLTRIAARPFARSIPLHSRCFSVQSKNKIRPDYFPYGVSNFEKIRRDGLFFKDTTRHLEIIEQSSRAVSIFRPARWGKSLFASIMEAYYCALNNKATNPAQFQLLFGDTHVGKNTTPKQGKYVVLFWDFTFATSGSVMDMEKSLYTSINSAIENCQKKYSGILKKSVEIDDDAMISFSRFASSVERSGYPLYLIVDEFDRFANKLLFETPDAYKKMVTGLCGDPASSMISSVLETAKSVSREVDMKTYITGIVPLNMAEMSGYNVCRNISDLKSVSSVVGFEESDIVRGLSEIFPSDMDAVQSHLNVMKVWYKGYRMHHGGPLLYNPTLCLRHMRNLTRGLSYTQLDVSDVNVAISDRIFELITKNPASNELVNGLFVGKEYSVKKQIFQLRDLLFRIHDVSRDYLLSFLFHHGVVTFSETNKLVIPNRLCRDQFLVKLRARLGESVIQDVKEFLDTGANNTLKSIIEDVATKLHSSSANAHYFNESSMRNAIHACFQTGCSRKIESEKIIAGSNLRPDIVVYNQKGDGIEFLIELGIIGIDTLNLQQLSECESLTPELKKSIAGIKSHVYRWSVKDKQNVENAVGKLSEDELLKLEFKPSGDNSYMTVETLLKEKAHQVWKYANDAGLADKKHHANLKCRAIVSVGMQGVVIRSADSSSDCTFVP